MGQSNQQGSVTCIHRGRWLALCGSPPQQHLQTSGQPCRTYPASCWSGPYGGVASIDGGRHASTSCGCGHPSQLCTGSQSAQQTSHPCMRGTQERWQLEGHDRDTLSMVSQMQQGSTRVNMIGSCSCYVSRVRIPLRTIAELSGRQGAPCRRRRPPPVQLPVPPASAGTCGDRSAIVKVAGLCCEA